MVGKKEVVEQRGTPVEVYERPASQFVASFIGGEFARPTHQQVIQLQTARRVEHPLANLLFAHATDFQAIGHVLFH